MTYVARSYRLDSTIVEILISVEFTRQVVATVNNPFIIGDLSHGPSLLTLDITLRKYHDHGRMFLWSTHDTRQFFTYFF